MSQPIPLDERTYFTPRAGLCALGVKLQAAGFFQPMASHLKLHQKTISHQPLDKLFDNVGGLDLTKAG